MCPLSGWDVPRARQFKSIFNQPYTLVVLYQDKVFNIQIRTNHNGFMLGTGLKSSEVLKLVFFI